MQPFALAYKRTNGRRTLGSVQALRAVAALLVLFFHASDGHFLVGAAGVDIFFVISGFIMGTVGVQENFRTFAQKRFVRVVPLYWAVTFAMCLGALFGVFSKFAFSQETLIKSLLFIPYFDASGHIWPLVVVGWTLNLEMLFYVVFAFGLMFRTPIVFATCILLGLVALGFIEKQSSPILMTWTSPLLLEFIAGLALAAWLKPPKSGALFVLALIGVTGLAASSAFGWFDESNRLLTWGVPSLLIVAGCIGIEHAGKWPTVAFGPLERLGDASYSLYLTHGIVVAAVHRAMGISLPSTMVILFASVAIAFALFYFFERPITRLGRSGVGHARGRLSTDAIR